MLCGIEFWPRCQAPSSKKGPTAHYGHIDPGLLQPDTAPCLAGREAVRRSALLRGL